MKLTWNFPYPSQRMPVLAKNVVATSQPLAAQAGLQMLQKGGNAVDAAIAAAITLTVVEPTSNSVGSDAFALIWDGKTLHGLNASGRSPALWSPEYFSNYKTMPDLGWDTVTVPGCVSAWIALSKRFGKLPFAELFKYAVHYAEQGYLVSPITSKLWQQALPRFQAYPEFLRTFLPNGKPLSPGELFKIPALAKTLITIAETEGEAFYRGILAEKIADYAKASGGALRFTDLAEHQPQWVQPIKQNYRDCELYEIPPNGQGLAALITLGILQHFTMTDFPVDSADSLHVQIEAMKLGFADAQRYIADPAAMTVEVDELLDPHYLAQRAQLIDLQQAKFPSFGLPPRHGTVYLTTADANGMMVSFIQSHYLNFGSGIVIPDTGISMQNRGLGFTLQPGHLNQVAGRKLPYHTIIPGFVMLKQQPLMSFGVMGGYMQAQGHVQVLVRLCDYQQNPQALIDAPRWYIGPDNSVSIEPKINPEVLLALAQRGHKIVNNDTAIFGGAQAIYKLTDGYFAASDSRKDGQAVGF